MDDEKLKELMKRASEKDDIPALVELIKYLIDLDKSIMKGIEALKKLGVKQKEANAKASTPYIS